MMSERWSSARCPSGSVRLAQSLAGRVVEHAFRLHTVGLLERGDRRLQRLIRVARIGAYGCGVEAEVGEALGDAGGLVHRVHVADPEGEAETPPGQGDLALADVDGDGERELAVAVRRALDR